MNESQLAVALRRWLRRLLFARRVYVALGLGVLLSSIVWPPRNRLHAVAFFVSLGMIAASIVAASYLVDALRAALVQVESDAEH